MLYKEKSQIFFCFCEIFYNKKMKNSKEIKGPTIRRCTRAVHESIHIHLMSAII